MAIVLLMLGITLWIIFRTNDLETIARTMVSLEPEWLLAALGCWCLYILFDALGFWFFFRRHGYPISVRYACYVSLMGGFYNGITPGSSGGQPMQIYYFSKKHIPAGVSTSAISVKFVLGQSATVLLVPILWIANDHFLSEQLSNAGWFVVVGWIIHLLSVLAVLLAAFCRPLVQKVAVFLVQMGSKLKLIRNPDAALHKLYDCIDNYQANVLAVGRNPKELVIQILLAILSLLSLEVIAVCIYCAFGLSGASWGKLLTIAYMLYLGASYNPLPGASGAQEGGFLLFYRGLFPEGQISLAMLLWRFFTYYLQLILGTVVMLGNTLCKSIRHKRDAATTHGI